MRQGTVDMAKGIAVLCMIQVHLMQLFARPELYDSLLGRLSLFLGGPPVAPVFLLIMGYFLARTRRLPKHLLRRGIRLVLLGLLLNIGLNGHLFLKIYQGELYVNFRKYLFGVDILLLAGISIIILAGLRVVWEHSTVPYLMLACGIVALTPSLNAGLVDDSWGKYVIACIGGEYPWAYFPLFPWFAYVLAGYLYALFQMRKLTSGRLTGRSLFGQILAGTGVAAASPYAWHVATDLKRYYHHTGWFVLWCIAFAGVWLLFLKIVHHDLGNTLLVRYLKWLGRHVTGMYAVQWLIIGNLATTLYKSQNLTQLIAWCAGIVVVSSSILYLVITVKNNNISSQRAVCAMITGLRP